MKTSYNAQRLNMLECQIKPFSVIDGRVLQAFETVAREEFVPAEQKKLAYLDEDLPVGNGRFMLEPPAFARLLQEANITENDKVLDVGCLGGYSTAILARLAGHVVALDDEAWVAQARKNLGETAANVQFVTGPLVAGDSAHAFYDVIVINGAIQKMPDSLIAQVKDGGTIACFWRNERGNAHAVVYTRHGESLKQRILFDAFVPVLPGFEAVEGFVF